MHILGDSFLVPIQKELGTLMMTVGMYFVVLNLVVDSVKYPLDTWKVAMIGVALLLNFCFINYSGSIVGGILESLKSIISGKKQSVLMSADFDVFKTWLMTKS